MAELLPSELFRAAGADETADAIRHACEPLPAPEKAEAFGAMFDRFGDARVVLLGESTHGSSEFYRARAAITRQLIERHGFNIVAVEADWPDAARIDRHVRHRATGIYDEESFARFPTWMWRNDEVAAFAECCVSTMQTCRLNVTSSFAASTSIPCTLR
ncbi:erythromycin esterase family protein [Aurantimonas sp. E1-2-R+4]|uniref:erythromycin esterase family protein n=1 Tax=Aurantimonas sp. E1-2-R+4 TaxID=3113714 RepID=UPI002F959B5A